MSILNQYREFVIDNEESLESLVSLFDCLSAMTLSEECVETLMSEELQAIEMLLELFKFQRDLRRHIIKLVHSILQDDGLIKSGKL